MKTIKGGHCEMKKRIFALALVASMILAVTACGKKEPADAGSDLIKVGIINNDPNESGYRTANDKSMKEQFTKANGYEATFKYSLKNDEQIAYAQKMIQDEVDYLLLSAADTSGWDSVLKDAKDAGIKVILFDRTVDASEDLM